MGSAEEREWVDVANDLLMKCNLHQRLNHLTDCGAEVFIHLYQAILGESVPDLITIPRCQEDDAHNVQAIIDSLALDYLQVSLSHITGENIVKGNKESIRNLLEIFDGLLEYLTEEISETASQNGDDGNQLVKDETQSGHIQEDDQDAPVPSLQLPSAIGSTESSDIFAPSQEADGSESTSELIKLGDTAYLFSLRNEELPAKREVSKRTANLEGLEASKEPSRTLSSNRRIHVTKTEGMSPSAELPREQLSSSAKKLGEPIRPAIPLQPPYQPSVPRSLFPANKDDGSLPRDSPPPPAKPQHFISSGFAELSEQEPATLSGAVSPSRTTSEHPAGDDAQNSGASAEDVAGKTVIDAAVNSRKEMDGSLQHTTTLHARPKSTSLPSTRPKQRNVLVGESQSESCSRTDSLDEVSFHHRRAKEKLSRQELREMSEKLSRRLNELDAMLKCALGEQTREESSADEDQLSQHSDSVMDYRERKAEPAISRLRRLPSRQRSLSTSPPPSSRQLSPKVHWRDMRGPSGKIQDQLQKEDEQRKRRAMLLAEAYEDELRAYEASELVELAKLKTKAEETEQKYKDHVFKAPQRTSQAAKIYSQKMKPRNPKFNQWVSKGGFAKPKKAAPLRIKENNLLPQLLEEFPHLHISRPAMKKMWQQQLVQIEQLKSPTDRKELKLQSELLETLKKHDLLVDLIKKEQVHNRRLQEFQQRIHRQKYTQNKLRERRQQVARAKRYYQDYRVQLRAKMMRARTQEEQIFKTLFEEGLEIQKQRLRELRGYAQEKRAEQRRQHQDELESMENYYKDQFSMLAEAVSEERQEIQARERAHVKTLHKVKHELRSKMEKEIKELQDMIMQNDDNSFFRELEADRLKSRLLVASFQYSKNHHFL